MFTQKKNIIGLAILLAIGCAKKPAMEMAVLSRHVLKDVPSASGIEVVDGAIYVIGDNSPWVYKLNKAYQIEDKRQIAPADNLENGIIPKKVKPDFEAMAFFPKGEEKELLIFSSGSKSPEREFFASVHFGQAEAGTKTYPITPFYEKLKTAAKLDAEELNIEGAVINGGELFLFNRGENVVMKYKMNEFQAYIEGKQESPEPIVYSIKLPEVKGVKAGFSGATAIPGEGKILFTASVENTANWIDDGEILGSFVGLIDLKNLKDGLQPECNRIMENGHPLNVKVESIAVYYLTVENSLRLVLVTDSDGGESELFEADLAWR